MDLGSASKYISTGECTERRIKIEDQDQAEELKMADGTIVRTEGGLQVMPKCGGYRGTISATVFPI